MEDNVYITMFTEYPDVVTIDNIMEMLHIGKNTAYGLLKDGTIKSMKVGDKYIVPKRCVIDFILTVLKNPVEKTAVG